MVETKCSKLANECKTNGNSHYRNKAFELALDCYSKCIRNSSFGSDSYVKCLGNKSAVLYEMQEYRKSISILEFMKQNTLGDQDYRRKLGKRLTLCRERTKGSEIIKTSAEDRVTNPSSPSKTAVVSIAGMARSLITTEDIHSDEVLLSLVPFAAVLGSDCWASYCYSCFVYIVDSVAVPCEGCSYVQYCSLECRDGDRVHRNIECRQMDKFRDLGILHLAIRVIHRISFELTENDCNEIHDLQDVLPLLPHDSDTRDLMELCHQPEAKSEILKYDISFPIRVVKSLPQFCKTDVKKTREIIATLASQLICNSSTIMKQSLVHGNTPIGSGIYPKIALMNHSCYSNIVCLFDGKVATLKTTQRVPQHEQLFNSYGVDFEYDSKVERQEQLFMQYNFKCSCQPCREDWKRNQTVRNAICMGCNSSIVIAKGTSTCSVCKISLTELFNVLQSLEEQYHAAYKCFTRKEYDATLHHLKESQPEAHLTLPDALLLDWNDLIKKCITAIHIVTHS